MALPADRWGSFTLKKLELNTKSPPELRAISQSANLSIGSGCSGLFRTASIRVDWLPSPLMNVRCWGKSRRHLLSRSLSAFDPGCVKTPTPNLRVEFPSRFRRCRNQLHWQLLSEERQLRKQFWASLARAPFHTAWTRFGRCILLKRPRSAGKYPLLHPSDVE